MLTVLATLIATGIGFDAAEEYRRALEGVESHDAAVDALLVQLHHGMEPEEETLEVLERAAGHLAALQRISAAQDVDWGLDYSLGPELTLPELGPLRQGTLLLDAKFLSSLLAGDAGAAQRSFHAAVRISEHIAQQELLISSLVGLAGVGMLDESVGRGVDMALIDADLARALLAAYERVQDDDYLSLRAALRRERDCMIGWLDRKLQEGPEAIAAVGLPVGDNVFTVAMLRANLVTATQAYDAFISASEHDDSGRVMAALQEVEAAVDRGEYGPMAELLSPAVSRMFQQRREAVARFTQRALQLERIASGAVEPWELASRPWLWILAARRAADSDEWWTHPETAGVVDLKLLRATAAAEGRFPEPWGSPDVAVPWWLPGQWSLLQGLFVRAGAQLDTGRGASAAVDVGIALDITAALAADGRPAASLVAAEALPVLADLVDRLVIAGQDVSQLAPLVRRLPSIRDGAAMGASGQQHAARLKAWHDRQAQLHEHWQNNVMDNPEVYTPANWPEPVLPPRLQDRRDAAGVVAALTAVRVLVDEWHRSSEPPGRFEGTAPPGLDQDTLDGVARWAADLTRANEPHAIDVQHIDPGPASEATKRLRNAVLRR